MTGMDAVRQILQDPLVLLLAALLLVAVYRFSGVRKRRLRKRRAALRVQARRAASPRERAALMQQWQELGGLREHARAARQRTAREEGAQARARGAPRSANPYGHALWGPGRLWKRGWNSVDRHIRWIEQRRG